MTHVASNVVARSTGHGADIAHLMLLSSSMEFRLPASSAFDDAPRT